jgi:CBS-domain-containing membrane protein
MEAKDIMTAEVVTVAPDAAVRDIAALLLERRISATPVVDAAGKLLGIVSEGDLMRRQDIGTAGHRSWWLDLISSPETRAADYVRSHGVKAADVMTTDLVTVAEDTPIGKIAETLERNHIKRVPVVTGGKLVGVVSRADLLRALVAQKEHVTFQQDTRDAAIREAIWAEITANAGVASQHVHVVVTQGTAHLWGAVPSETEKRAAEMAAGSVSGVKAVENHLNILPTNVVAGGL